MEEHHDTVLVAAEEPADGLGQATRQAERGAADEDDPREEESVGGLPDGEHLGKVGAAREHVEAAALAGILHG